MKIYIKHMVSPRCKATVHAIFHALGLPYSQADGQRMGEMELQLPLSAAQYGYLQARLFSAGYELLNDKKAQLITRLKAVIVELIHLAPNGLPRLKNSDYISTHLAHDYTYLANLFSDVTGGTIEHYIITHKIQWVKELLLHSELSITQISHKLHYSSVAHLSNQFKKVTGITPTDFKQIGHA